MCDMLSVVISLKSQTSQTSGQNKYWGEVGVGYMLKFMLSYTTNTGLATVAGGEV